MTLKEIAAGDTGEPIKPDKPSGGGGCSVISGGIGGLNSGSSTVSTGTATKEAAKAIENAVKAAAGAGSKSANAAATFIVTPRRSSALRSRARSA